MFVQTDPLRLIISIASFVKTQQKNARENNLSTIECCSGEFR